MTDRRVVRVLSVIGNLSVGGTETFLTRIAPAIRAHGVDMEVCALERIGPRLQPLEEAGIRVHGTPYITRAERSNTLTLLQTVDSIRRIVRSGRFDIVHTYLFWSDVLGVPGARLAGCPRIILSRRALHSWGHAMGSSFHHTLEQSANLLANELVANSKAALKDAEAHERFLPAIRTVIYNGIETDGYETAQPSLDGPLKLVTVGALAPRKGQEFAIEALAILKNAGIEARWQMVGSGSDQSMLRRKAQDAGVEGWVSFAGEQTDPRPFLAAADLFVLPSRQEGFSNALLEAMATALPIVATDAGGNAEAIVDGEGGCIVPPEEPAALAAAIAQLAGNRSKLADMGRLNRTRVKELFSLEVSARNLADWYFFGGLARRS